MTALHVVLGGLALMACTNILGKPRGVLGKPSGDLGKHVLGKRSEHRRSPRNYCEVDELVEFYMETMKKSAQKIITNRFCKRLMNKKRGCKLNSFLQNNFCQQSNSTGIQDVLKQVNIMMNQLKDLVDFVRGHGNIKARNNHIVWIQFRRAFEGIDMALNNATSHIQSSLFELQEDGSRDRSASDAIAKYNGREIKRACIVACDIVDVIDCSKTMLAETTTKVC